MQYDPITQLKQLKNIEPDANFAEKGRLFLLSQKPSFSILYLFSFRKSLILTGSFVGLTVVLLLLSPILFTTTQNPALSSLDNSTKLNQELNNLSINIELREISYKKGANQTITAAITEISNTQTKHLNPSVLNSESEMLDPLKNTKDSSDNIDKLLERVIF